MHKIDNGLVWPAAVARVVNRLCGGNDAQTSTDNADLKSGTGCGRIPAIQLRHR